MQSRWIASALGVFGLLSGAGPALAGSEKGSSAEETATYIAAKLEKCGRSRWGEGAGARTQVRAAIRGPAISIVKTEFGMTGQPFPSTTLKFDIRDIREIEPNAKDMARWSPRYRGKWTRLIFRCGNSLKFVHSAFKTHEAYYDYTDLPPCVADTEERLGRAFRHVMKIAGKRKELF